MKEFHEEVNSTSSAFMDVRGKDNTIQSDVGSSYISNSTRRGSISSLSTNISSNYGYQNSNEDDAYNGTEICVVCLKKGVKKKATHFCKTCDTYGRYICYKCMNQHNIWCLDHEVVSLSIGRQTDGDWRRREKNKPVRRGHTDYQNIDSWVQNTTLDEECEYGELDELEMASQVVTPSAYYSDNSRRVLSDTIEVQRPQLPLPKRYENLGDQHYDTTGGNQYFHIQNDDDDTLTHSQGYILPQRKQQKEDYGMATTNPIQTQGLTRNNKTRQNSLGVEEYIPGNTTESSVRSDSTIRRLSTIYSGFNDPHYNARFTEHPGEHVYSPLTVKKKPCTIM